LSAAAFLSTPKSWLKWYLGILLVAEKDHALVKYATAGMDENLFIQKYLVQLPDKNQLGNYIETEMKKFNQ
jgi:hypothetical protein